MSKYIAKLEDLSKNDLSLAGGKGANLGELLRIPGLSVPPGFCVTTRAYRDFVASSPEFDSLLKALDSVERDSPDRVKELAEQVRLNLSGVPIPKPIEEEIISALKELRCGHAYAVRSSATAEDLPGASFAGQQDTFLNVQSQDQILDAVRKCWASLFTERAVVYRRQNNFSHHEVALAVIVQQMIFSEVSGIMFTADPVSGNRRIVSIDASFGLGEALVSGLVSADLYQVKEGRLIKRQVSSKNMQIKALPQGGTEKIKLGEKGSQVSSLSDDLAVQLASIGRQIEAHFCNPQDIEWAITQGQIHILQSRPITTLYPRAPVSDDRLHLFFSFGHVQMMTEAMKPLGISAIRTLFPVGKNSPEGESVYLQEAGNRLYGDLTLLLRYPFIRKRLPSILVALDESISRSVKSLIARDEFQAALQPELHPAWSTVRGIIPYVHKVAARIIYRNNEGIIDETNRFMDAIIQKNRLRLASAAGAERIAVIQDMLTEVLPNFVSQLVQTLPPAIGSYFLISHFSKTWLGDENELPSISKAPSGNVTTEMGLRLGDLGDAIRNHPLIVDYLGSAHDGDFWEGLRQIPGSEEVAPAFESFFAHYGMRGTGEIDITRPRWEETPTQMIPILLMNISQNQPGQHRQEFACDREEAKAAGRLLVERLRQKPWGMVKAPIMRRLIKVHRSLIGVREHPKYFLVQILWLVKLAILEEADKLAAVGLLANREDIFWFSLQEIKEMICRQHVDLKLMAQRQESYEGHKKLSPPRLMTSEGEIIREETARDLPAGAIGGSPVSAGVVEGRARVVLHLEEARMERGDVLVAPYTDPSWTPLFTLAAGLVTEVGGLMTHGAVVAREYGIPAVVGVDGATRLIKDGERIRVDGTQGFVQILNDNQAESKY